MACDIVDLLYFYETPLGRATKKIIADVIHSFEISGEDETVLGIGYPVPYLSEQNHCFVFMPAQQGIVHWPQGMPSRTALVDEDRLPLPDESVDRVVVIHALEHAQALHPFLREIWRVLKGDGRLIVVTPNRRSMWARFESTPFGHGSPFTMTQLSQLLKEAQFTPVTTKRGLYVPPLQSRLFLTTAPLWEKIGGRLLQKFSGIVAIESVKQVYAVYPIRNRRTVTIPGLVAD
jgi:SAM-dependent methyltransferase